MFSEEKNLVDTIHEILSKGRVLLEKGDYQAALRMIQPFREQKKLPITDRLAFMLLESKLRAKQMATEKGLTLVDGILQLANEREMPLLIVDTLVVKAELYWLSGKFDEGLATVERGEALLAKMKSKVIDKKQIKQRKGALLHQKGVIYWFKGNLDRALDCHQQSLIISKALSNKRATADALNNLGLVFYSKGDLNQALKYHKQSLELREKQNNRREIAASLSNLGNVCAMKGDLDQALQYHQRSLVIKEELGVKQDTARTLVNIGVVFQLRGDLDQALEYYQRSLAINEALGNRQNLALSINNIGNIHELRGDLDKALNYFQRSLALFKELGIKQQIALVLTNIAEIHRKKGSLAEALEYFQKGLTIYEEMGNNLYITVVLFDLIQIALQREDTMLVQQYLQKLQQINEQEDNRIIDQRYRVAKALSLKAGKRTRHKIKAIEILEQVVEEEISDHSLTVTAMIHLCDLLLAELKLTGEEELFSEIKDLTSQLLKIAKQQSSHSLLAETYLLQSKLALIELDMGQARKFLNKATLIAEEKGLQLLARAIKNEHNLLLSRLNKWESIIKQNPSKQEMIDFTKLDNLLEGMIRKTAANLLIHLDEKDKVKAFVEQKIEKTAKLAYLKSGQETAMSEYIAKPTPTGHIKSGLKELDDLLLGGIPRDYAVILISPSCDERDILIKLFLEAGAKNGEVAFHMSTKTTGIDDLVENFPSDILLFVCNPQAEKIMKNVPNIIKLKGLESLTAVNIAVTSAIRGLSKPLMSPRRICIETISDVLLQHHAMQTRKWLNALIPQLKSNGFTTLAVIDSEVHSLQEIRTIAGVFQGEIDIYEKETSKGPEKFLKIRKMTNQKYSDSELLLRREDLQK